MIKNSDGSFGVAKAGIGFFEIVNNVISDIERKMILMSADVDDIVSAIKEGGQAMIEPRYGVGKSVLHKCKYFKQKALRLPRRLHDIVMKANHIRPPKCM